MKSRIYFLLAIGIMMLLAADVNAQVKGGSFSVTPYAGYSQFAERGLFEDTETYGLAIGYDFSERFGIEATYNILDTEIVPEGVVGAGVDPDGPGPAPAEPGEVIIEGGIDADAYQYGFEMLFYVYPGKKFAAYAVVGIGQSHFEYADRSDSELNCPMGFGFKYFVTDMIAVRADLRAAYPSDQNNIRATAGVTFQFGGN